ncbi:Protein of unknown function [Gryllus bimaculatus]|nr:Protein of unknown function [Gryllus bimaculatus]
MDHLEIVPECVVKVENEGDMIFTMSEMSVKMKSNITPGAEYSQPTVNHSKTGTERYSEMCDVFNRGNERRKKLNQTTVPWLIKS